MIRSLRWRLQLWNALILLLVVGGFGGVLYAQIRVSRFTEIDADLHAAARTLEGTLRGYPPHFLGIHPDAQGPGHKDWPGPPPPEFRSGIENRPGGKEKYGPPPGSAKDGPPRPGHHRPKEDRPRPPIERDLVLPEHFRQRFGEDRPYFIIWMPNNEVLRSVPAELTVPPVSSFPADGVGYTWRQRDDLREVMVMGPHRIRVLVGRSIGRELGELDRLAWQLLFTGLGVLGVGLAGGWLLSRRAVRPIETMSATAETISADNLSRRIELAGVDSELAGLGQILNAMFARLEAAFERQVQFTADASHELRTPLAVIHSHAELALSRSRSAEEYRRTLETCLRASRRMKTLVEGLLTLARADASRLELACESVELSSIVRESVALLRPLAEQAGVSVAVKTQPVELRGDAGRLGQVVTNLLTNAIHYNRPGGEVVAVLEVQDEKAVFSVSDTGCGIPEEDRPHIFERFYRVDKARAREKGHSGSASTSAGQVIGCGLGLAICKSIVEAHGGEISYTSQVGQGTTFVVRLPLSAAGDYRS